MTRAELLSFEQPVDLVVLLRDLRGQSGLSQRQLARASGVGEKTISTFETGTRIHTLSVDQLRNITSALGVTLSDFFRILEGRQNQVPPLGGYEEYRRALVQLVTRAYHDGLTRADVLGLLADAAQIPPVGARSRRSPWQRGAA